MSKRSAERDPESIAYVEAINFSARRRRRFELAAAPGTAAPVARVIEREPSDAQPNQNSASCGGARAPSDAVSAVSSPRSRRCARIRSISSGSSLLAITFKCPPQRAMRSRLFLEGGPLKTKRVGRQLCLTCARSPGATGRPEGSSRVRAMPCALLADGLPRGSRSSSRGCDRGDRLRLLLVTMLTKVRPGRWTSLSRTLRKRSASSCSGAHASHENNRVLCPCHTDYGCFAARHGLRGNEPREHGAAERHPTAFHPTASLCARFSTAG